MSQGMFSKEDETGRNKDREGPRRHSKTVMPRQICVTGVSHVTLPVNVAKLLCHWNIRRVSRAGLQRVDLVLLPAQHRVGIRCCRVMHHQQNP